MILLLSSALAWQSECFTGQPDPDHAGHPQTCDDGYDKARNRYVWDGGIYSAVRFPEHAIIFDLSADKSGVPTGVFEDFTVDTFIKPTELGVDDFTSIRPRRQGIEEKYTRTLRASEMAQLPDMSYSLWDWAMGNEVCPLGELDVQTCHTFEKHMGGLNSSHFVPQSQGFYAWYHQLALERADQCLQAHDAMEGLYEDRPDLEDYVLACEKSAMVIEAVGQHYLQDSWSSGHMWERWGSPELAVWFDAADGDTGKALGRAMLVALFSGSWHGVKGVLEDPKSKVQNGFLGFVTPDTWDDPMCAPATEDSAVRYIGVDGAPHDMVGDLFFALTGGDPYDTQNFDLLSCASSGIREVYEATGQAHEPIGALAPGVDQADPTSERCFGQRATNQSLALGAEVHYGEAPDQSAVPFALNTVIWSLAKAQYKGEGDVDLDGMKEQFRAEAAAHVAWVQAAALHDQDETDGAQGFLYRPEEDRTLMDVRPNGAYAVLDGTEPSSWVDPGLPWDLGTDQGEALSLAFADASAWGRCDQMDVESLESLRHPSWPEVPTDEDLAIRDQCRQLVDPFLRVGTSGDHHAADKQPLCHFAGGDTFVYSGHADYGEVGREQALDGWCAKELLEDGGFEQRSGWTVDYNADILSGVNTLVPYNGSQMLDLYLTPDASAAFGRAYQYLDEDLGEGSWELQFMWRVWTSWYPCKSWGDPWAVARVDGVDIGEVEIAVFDLANTLWCEDLVPHSGGRYKSEWTQATLAFEGPVEEPVISFIMGTGTGTDDHHLLIDDVKLVRAD